MWESIAALHLKKKKNRNPLCFEIRKHLTNICFPNVLLPPALKCPSGSHYNVCSSACPQPSCQDPVGNGGPCNQPCVEGCICDPGLILSGDKCVPLSECGCTDGDKKYRPVSVFRWNVQGSTPNPNLFFFSRKYVWTYIEFLYIYFICAICGSPCVYVCVGGRHLVHWEGLLAALQV